VPLLRAKGFVLRNRPLGETDRLVTCFTLEHGKIAGVAKGLAGCAVDSGVVCNLSLIRLMLFGKRPEVSIASTTPTFSRLSGYS
jgi:recombinational DNA repair protein (RecF pathway)